MTVHYYVYYRVARPDEAATREVIRALVAGVERTTGVAGRLLVRSDDPCTWMEIYEAVPDPSAFELALARAVDESGFGAIIAADSSRHVERFQSP